MAVCLLDAGSISVTDLYPTLPPLPLVLSHWSLHMQPSYLLGREIINPSSGYSADIHRMRSADLIRFLTNERRNI